MSASPVTVVTVSFHSGPQFPGFLSSLDTATESDPPIVIVDNAHDDAELAELVAQHDRVTVMVAGANLGYGAGMNRGVHSAEPTDWLLLANPDLSFDAGSLDELVRVGEADPSIGVVGPLIHTESGEVYPSARNLPSLRTGIGHAVFARIWRSNPWTRAYLAEREHPPRQRDAGWLSGACLLVRRSAFESIGGFDEKFFMYFEDVDLGARIGRAGWRLVYAPTASVTHAGGQSTARVSTRMIRAHHQSAYLYLASKYPQWYLGPLRGVLRLGLFARSRLIHRA